MRHMHIIYTVYVYVPILCIGVHVYAYWADANYAYMWPYLQKPGIRKVNAKALCLENALQLVVNAL